MEELMQQQANFNINVLNKNTHTDTDYHKISHMSSLFLQKQLLHPNLLKYLGVVCDDAQAVVITEKIDMTTLRKHLLSSPNRVLSEPEVRVIFRGIIAGLEHVHAHGLTHSHLHLDNIFWDVHRSALKLGDYAVSSLVPLLTRPDSDDMHPYIFVAPEVWFNIERSSDTCADIWSLGVILYTLVNGHYPFFATNKADLFKEIMKGATKFSPMLSPQCLNLIMSLMQLSPDDRPNLDQIKEHEWMTMNITPHRHNLLSSAPSPSPLSPGLMQAFASPSPSPIVGSPLTQQTATALVQQTHHMQQLQQQQHDDFYGTNSNNNKRRGSWTAQGDSDGDTGGDYRFKRRNTVANIDESTVAVVDEREIQEEKQKWIDRIRSAPPTKASDFAERRRNSLTGRLPVNIQALLPPQFAAQMNAPSSSSSSPLSTGLSLPSSLPTPSSSSPAAAAASYVLQQAQSIVGQSQNNNVNANNNSNNTRVTTPPLSAPMWSVGSAPTSPPAPVQQPQAQTIKHIDNNSSNTNNHHHNNTNNAKYANDTLSYQNVSRNHAANQFANQNDLLSNPNIVNNNNNSSNNSNSDNSNDCDTNLFLTPAPLSSSSLSSTTSTTESSTPATSSSTLSATSSLFGNGTPSMTNLTGLLEPGTSGSLGNLDSFLASFGSKTDLSQFNISLPTLSSGTFSQLFKDTDINALLAP